MLLVCVCTTWVEMDYTKPQKKCIIQANLPFFQFHPVREAGLIQTKFMLHVQVMTVVSTCDVSHSQWRNPIRVFLMCFEVDSA